MNKPVVTALVAVILVIGGVVLFALGQPEKDRSGSHNSSAAAKESDDHTHAE